MKISHRVTVSMNAALLTVSAAFVVSCGGGSKAADTVHAAQTAAAPSAGTAACPADGRWAECSLTDRLMRAGLGVRVDSAPAAEPALPSRGLLYHIGSAKLEVFLFADSAARKVAAAKLDSSQFMGYNDAQQMQPKRSLIQSANLLALLDSRRDDQRQRVGDAITAGPPQPPHQVR